MRNLGHLISCFSPLPFFADDKQPSVSQGFQNPFCFCAVHRQQIRLPHAAACILRTLTQLGQLQKDPARNILQRWILQLHHRPDRRGSSARRSASQCRCMPCA